MRNTVLFCGALALAGIAVEHGTAQADPLQSASPELVQPDPKPNASRDFSPILANGGTADASHALNTASAAPVQQPAASRAVLPPSVYAASTIRQFLPFCGKDQGGCADEVGMALNDKMVMDGTASICLPGPDYAGAAIAWLKAHPEVAAMPTEDGIYLALRKVYACG